MSKNRSVSSLRADEIFGAVTEAERAVSAGAPFPFSNQRPQSAAALAKAAFAADKAAKAAATAAAKAAKAIKNTNRSGTPEFGREEAKQGL